MFAFDRAAGTFACTRSYGIFAINRVNALLCVFVQMPVCHFSFESGFVFFRANSHSRFIECIYARVFIPGMHVRVVSRECPFASCRLVLSSESTLTSLLNEWTLVFFSCANNHVLWIVRAQVDVHRTKTRVRSIDRRHIGICHRAKAHFGLINRIHVRVLSCERHVRVFLYTWHFRVSSWKCTCASNRVNAR